MAPLSGIRRALLVASTVHLLVHALSSQARPMPPMLRLPVSTLYPNNTHITLAIMENDTGYTMKGKASIISCSLYQFADAAVLFS